MLCLLSNVTQRAFSHRIAALLQRVCGKAAKAKDSTQIARDSRGKPEKIIASELACHNRSLFADGAVVEVHHLATSAAPRMRVVKKLSAQGLRARTPAHGTCNRGGICSSRRRDVPIPLESMRNVSEQGHHGW